MHPLNTLLCVFVAMASAVAFPMLDAARLEQINTAVLTGCAALIFSNLARGLFDAWRD